MKSFFMLLTTVAVVGILGMCTGWCHGVDGYVETISGHGISAMYDDGEPMSYSAVEIKAPNSDVAFQTGRTDRNGWFLVNPDIPGDWKAVVSDGMGHRLELAFTVAADQEKQGQVQEKPERAAQTTGPARPVNRSMGIVAGLSIIFGLFGMAYGWTGRRRSA